MSDKQELVECECGSTIFTEVVSFVEVSAVVSANGKAGIAPAYSTYICMNCGADITLTEAVKKLSESKSALVL